MTATSDLKPKTRKAWLIEDAEKSGLYIRTYSPGDGVTRYRFFRHLESSCECNHQTYFGPASGIYTALGLKEAETFVRGYSERSAR